MGDWEVNEEKINLHEVIDYAHSKNIKFGLWIEPEMIIDHILIGALMTLVPGLALTNALRDLFMGDLLPVIVLRVLSAGGF